MIRRFGIAFVFAALLLVPTPAAAQGDTLDCARTIVGCADAGPEPEHSGDRGGYAQFLTLGFLVGGVGFIGYKITSAVRARDANMHIE